MAQQINADIVINGQKISPFSNLTIHQQFNHHHYFELRFNHDVLEDKNSVLINKSKDFLGEQVTITFSTKYDTGYPENVFKGIVSEISISNDINSAGDLIFKGYSPTILMEGGEHNASFNDKNLTQIVKSATGDIPGNVLTSSVMPAYKSSIPFVVQYRESNFDFLRRLAAEYGEWFFYDGTKFNFGKPSGGATIELKYPRDISNLNLQVKVAPVNFENTAYFSKEDKKFNTASSSQSVNGLDSFGSHALNASQKLYQKPVNALSGKPVQAKNTLDELVNVKKSAAASRMVSLNASSDSPYIKLGATLSVSAAKGKSTEDFGKFLVTSVIHSTDGLGNYSNIFEAVPSTLKVVPNPYFQKPAAEPQLAIVKNNTDPDNIGRVRVQMLWQKDNDMTPFIRVMMPHSGLRGNNKKNRGAFFTPEVGDYVIVGFTQNDPDRPFVMGSVPHGKAINTAMNSDNDAKAIRTRSGNTIYFFDRENKNEQEIKIETDDKNYISILLNNSKGNIKIYSTDTIDVKSDKVVNVTSKDIHIKASNDVTIQANNNISIKANKKIEISAQEIKSEAAQAYEAKGMNVKVEGTLNTAVKGMVQLDLQGGAAANLKAGLVKIN